MTKKSDKKKSIEEKSIGNNLKNEDIYLEERIVIPGKWDEFEGMFSWKKLWLFTGPGWLSKSLF